MYIYMTLSEGIKLFIWLSWLVLQIVRLYDTLNRRVIEDMAQYKAQVDKKIEEWKKNQQNSNESYLLSFNAPHRRSTKRNPFRRINKVIVRFYLYIRSFSYNMYIYTY